jgi:predicted RNA binding protein YcfA (HicA-like mRNA interferase family)
MPKIIPIPARKLVKLLEKLGFEIVRQKGSHIIMMDKNRRRIVIPSHPGKDIKPSLVRVIIKEVGISREEFFELLKKV